jgi:low temperature requirement protein LtrA
MSEREQRVTPLELFFDLVFVFGLTQVTSLMSDDPTWAGLGRGLLVLAALWWTWAGYAWLTNTLEPEETVVRVAMVGAMAAMLVVALAVPGAWGDDGVLFAVAYLVARLLFLLLYGVAGKRDPEILVAVLRLAPTAILAPGLLIVAGFLDGTAQAALWLATLTAEYVGGILAGSEGWRVSPAHFAERHGLIVIIALGESIVAIGIGAEKGLTAGVVAAAARRGQERQRGGPGHDQLASLSHTCLLFPSGEPLTRIPLRTGLARPQGPARLQREARGAT